MNDPKAEETIFAATLNLPPEQRGPYLDQACGPDVALRQRVETLLDAYLASAEVLEQPAANGLDETSEASPFLSEKAGDRIGRYKLLQQIGEGGCGVVYMAEQDKPVQRRVALKVIKLGMDTKQVIARFEAERQALAMMDHPNIAKVLDAGATETGRPYFVMELVRGVKITDYCDHNNLTTPERLDLFVQVCRAIQHAHQKGIIHRDIKPSNILVTLHDGVPVPKVIDFGIAKATQGRLTDLTLFTAFEQFVGTPAYMSPEQAELSGLDIDTRSDIYSLGVLLYELLTGKTPFDGQQLMAAGLEAMRRTIREREPDRPSTKLSTMAQGELTTTAKRRHTEAPKLLSAVRGDLDWIVMRCLEKDRARRYETANGLASDIQRHLNQEPVVACPPSTLYRFQKLVRRNTLAFAAGGGVVAALILGLGASAWMYVRERAATREQVTLRKLAEANEKSARSEAQKSEQVAQILENMFKGVDPNFGAGHDAISLREIVDKTVVQVRRDLTNQPEVEIEVCNIMAEVYGDFGLHEQEREMARRGLELARRLAPSSAVAKALAVYAKMVEPDKTKAEELYREALAMETKLHGNKGKDLGWILQMLGYHLGGQGRTAEAEKILLKRLEVETELHGSESAELAEVYDNLGGFWLRQGKLEESESMYRRALALFKKARGEKSPRVAEEMNWMIPTLEALGKKEEANSMRKEALAIRQEIRGGEQQDTAQIISSLAGLGKWAEAERLAFDDVNVRQKASRSEHLIAALDVLGQVLEAQRKHAQAEVAFRRSLALVDKEDPSYYNRVNNLAIALFAQDKMTEAEPMFREALAANARNPQNDRDVAVLLENLGNALLAQGKIGEASVKYTEARLQRHKAAAKAAESGNGQAQNELAWTMATSQDPKARDGVKAVALAEKSVAASNRADPMTLDTLAAAYAESGLFTKASAVQKEAINLLRDEYQKKDFESRLKLYDMNVPYREVDYIAVRRHSSILQRHHQLTKAEKALREALVVPENSVYEENPAVGFTLNDLGNLLLEEGKLAEAETALRRALKLTRHIFGDQHQETATVLANLSSVLRKESKLDEAAIDLRQALEIQRKTSAKEHPEELALSLRTLAFVLTDQGKLPDAEAAAREALDITRNLPEGCQPTSAGLLQIVGDILLRQKKTADAANVYNEFLSTPECATNAQLLQVRGEFFARIGQWKEAAADLNRAIEFRPDQQTTWHSLAPVLVQLGDLEAYRNHCRNRLERFGTTTEPYIAERISKDCLILAASGVDPELVGKMAEVASSVDTNDPALPWFQTSKALAEYRRGSFASAADWAQQALSKTGTNWNRDVQAQTVLAMAHHELRHADQAQANLAKAREIAAAKMPKLEDNDLGAGWLDWIIARTLLREASDLIEGVQSARSNSAKSRVGLQESLSGAK